jgi:DNA-binding transcriptional MerR regulator
MMPNPYPQPRTLYLFPDKLFFKIGEVSKIVGVEAYVLRYWETEFLSLCPKKSKSGQRIYTKKDIDLIMQIKQLLYEEKYTIEGVRKKLLAPAAKQLGDPLSAPETFKADYPFVLERIKDRLRNILNSMS